MDTQRQKHLVLILAREFAASLSTPTLVADARGYLVYYNEAAEAVVGRRFAEEGEMPLEDWLAAFEPRTLAAEPLPPERRPARIAFEEQRASHLRYLVTSADGEPSTLANERPKPSRNGLAHEALFRRFSILPVHRLRSANRDRPLQSGIVRIVVVVKAAGTRRAERVGQLGLAGSEHGERVDRRTVGVGRMGIRRELV